MLTGKRILLIVTGNVAAYKALELIRLLRKAGAGVVVVITRAAGEFVTPMSLAMLSGEEIHTDLFSLKDETEIGHIQLSRGANLVIVAPAIADILAKMAEGIYNDLATTLLLATDKRVLAAPAVNIRMWFHPATQRKLDQLGRDCVLMVGPDADEMACGEFGPVRMVEPQAILEAIRAALAEDSRPALAGPGTALIDVPVSLSGQHAVVTSGLTHEPIDSVRYIANGSSGKQGHSIAAALAALGCRVILVTGPICLTDPTGVDTIHIESAREMLAVVEAALPADIAVCAAAVADWWPAIEARQKPKKQPGGALPPGIRLIENPDILCTVSAPGPSRPALVVDFAAGTEQVLDHACDKRTRKGCDWIVANDVSTGTGTFGGGDNAVHLIDADGTDNWPAMTKQAVVDRLARRIADHFSALTTKDST